MATASKQAARNREIMIASASGESTKEIAARYDLTTTRVRQIISTEAPVLADARRIDPVSAALERRAQYEAIYEDAVAFFERIPDSEASPKVGALRLALAALDRLSAWDKAMGVVPENLVEIGTRIGLRRFMEVFMETIEGHDQYQELVATISEMMEGENREPSHEFGPIPPDPKEFLSPL